MHMKGIVKTTLLAGALSWSVMPTPWLTAAQAQEEAEPSSLFHILNDKVKMSALLEADITAGSDYEDVSTSDITLSTMEFGVEAQVNEWTTGNIVLLWEEDATEPVDLDEATITFANAERCPFSTTVGLMTLPFGVYETNMVSDPLTLELAETGGSAVLAGLEARGFYGSLYGFNGDVDKQGDDDAIAAFGAKLGYAWEKDAVTLDLGADWINNIANSDGLSGSLSESAAGAVEDNIGGVAAHALLGVGAVSCIAEYVEALDSYTASELAFGTDGATPKALQLEAAFTTEIVSHETVFALGYQQSEEAVSVGLPETRYLATVGVNVLDNTAVALEYLHNEDYSVEDGGTGGDANQVTGHVAVEF